MRRISTIFEVEPEQLQKNILSTYFSLRIGIAVIGLALPIVLSVGGHFYAKLPLQPSMSDYYLALGETGKSMRDWFVGFLFVVGLFLYLYQGYSKLENYLLNIGGILCIGIAVIPKCNQATSSVPCGWFTPHGFCAITFFLCISSVFLFCAHDTLELIRDAKLPNADKKITLFKTLYRAIAVVMIGSIGAAWLLNEVAGNKHVVFWVEFAGIWSFAAYWLLKSKELSDTAAESKAIAGRLVRVQGRLRETERPPESARTAAR
jgi:hypothetical protein